jgi:hypothetical protein
VHTVSVWFSVLTSPAYNTHVRCYTFLFRPDRLWSWYDMTMSCPNCFSPIYVVLLFCACKPYRYVLLFRCIANLSKYTEYM